VSGKTLAAGIAADPEPVASAIPLTYFSNGAKPCHTEQGHARRSSSKDERIGSNVEVAGQFADVGAVQRAFAAEHLGDG